MKISVIIPALNEESSLPQTLEALTKLEHIGEIIVVDGRSADRTVEIATEFGAKVVKFKPGRGIQLHAGAREAQHEILWFLHADTLPPADADKEIIAALADKKTIGGNFNIRFDGERRAAKMLTRLYPKLRLLGLCYGDSAFFVRRDVYVKTGGFKDLPLFEDVEFYSRLKKQGHFAHLKSFVISSSRRFENRSFTLTFARWSLFQGLYWLGCPPRFLAKYYAPIRK
jgi:rSAM/selenodomain-associated transferase 2